MPHRYTDDDYDQGFADMTAQKMLIDKGLPEEFHDAARQTCRWMAQILSGIGKANKANHDWGRGVAFDNDDLRAKLEKAQDENDSLGTRFEMSQNAVYEFRRLVYILGALLIVAISYITWRG